MSGFKVGDQVYTLINLGFIPKGTIGTITNNINNGEDLEHYSEAVWFPGKKGTYYYSPTELKLVGSPSPPTEERAVDPNTGGAKGRKKEEYAFIPPFALAELARVYGMGAKKYDPWNWARGYPYSWSLSALYRHVEAFRRGENTDPESGLSHLAHATFHLFTLMEFEKNGLGTDDRWIPNES